MVEPVAVEAAAIGVEVVVEELRGVVGLPVFTAVFTRITHCPT